MASAIVLAYDDSNTGTLSTSVPLASIAILPEPGDNCAIVRATVDVGTRVTLASGLSVALSHRILEGHRFAAERIPEGSPLLSWGLPFGFALRDIAPGEYVANASMLSTLGARGVPGLPAVPNFADHLMPFAVDRESCRAAPEVPLTPDAEAAVFDGFSRPGGRGVGTRNYVVLVGTTSASAGYVRALEVAARAAGLASGWPTVDGVVCVAHTEGAGSRAAGDLPHNHALLVETLASYALHPNVNAALLFDYGADEETVWAADVVEALGAAAADAVVVAHRLTGDHAEDVRAGLQRIAEVLPIVGAARRTPQPASGLSIAQQCGGSDAFSGVSGNPAAGDAARRLVAAGGQTVLAETDELIGAEAYVLQAAKDYDTAAAFLEIIRAFKERLAWHGQTAEANPTGGNKMRGLYNIALKSLGAAKKKHAEVRLEGVLRYAERSRARGRGYYMMDSPGNDLESIAGQVATGCNVIHFITGNGSITNFPFVPTIKIVTTTGRFTLLERDMDFNAGRFQEGTPMAALGAELYALTLAAAGGARTVGERAGHSQVAIWRNWPQAGPADLSAIQHGPRPGEPLSVLTSPGLPALDAVTFEGYPGGGRGGRPATARVGLVLPTSLCSGEVGRQIAEELDRRRAAGDAALSACSSFASLPHTEGCCTGYAEGGIALYDRVMLGHLAHPSVAQALLLEHGCEKTHNDYFRTAMASAGIAEAPSIGFASIQLDGGIAAVTAKVVRHFEATAAACASSGGPIPAPPPRGPVDVCSLDIGVLVDAGAAAAPGALAAVAALAVALAAGGGRLILPLGSPALAPDSPLAAAVPGLRASREALEPTLAFAQSARSGSGDSGSSSGGGVHVMDMPAVRDVAEAVAGLAAAGAQAIVALSAPLPLAGATRASPRPVGGHPFVPVVRICLVPQGGPQPSPAEAAAADAVLRADAAAGDRDLDVARGWAAGVLRAVAAAVGPGAAPTRAQQTATFSVARGLTGVTT